MGAAASGALPRERAHSRQPFLTSKWLDLVFLNYEVPPSLLEPLLPKGTELDSYGGRLLASVVGLRFEDTRVRGLALPFHRDFDEVNLRFYVRRYAADGELRRAVVFVSELVPLRAVAWVARRLYNEPYSCVTMSHAIAREDKEAVPSSIEYTWRWQGGAYALGGRPVGPLAALLRPSEAEFVSEHFWGYTRQRDGSTLEYEVYHPAWEICPLAGARLQGDVARLYGARWGGALSAAPASAFYARGSKVEVFAGQALSADPA